jgi:hypothetical protein
MKNTANKPVADPPIEPPADQKMSADEKIALLLAVLEDMRIENRNLKSQNWQHIAEKAERERPEWSTLVRAHNMENCTYDRAFRWANRAIKAGRTNEARVDGNDKIWANRKALRVFLRG